MRKSIIGIIMAVALVGASIAFPVQAYAVDVEAGQVVEDNSKDDIIGNNHGTVVMNFGTVENNKSEGTVDNNLGTVKTNDGGGTVTTNDGGGTVTTNDGRIRYNHGTVENNHGTVEDNIGTVVTNDGGTVVNNFGTVKNNSKGKIFIR